MQSPDQQKSPDGFVARANLGALEFILLAATLTAMGAMSIDIMLPILPDIGASFAIEDENRAQLVIVAFSLAFALGQLIFAPLSDRFGRKPLLLTGIVLYFAGAAGSALSSSFEMLLIMRFVQGLGGSTLRSVVVATVRDCFEGDAMSRVMTFVYTIFMLVPMAAPFIGHIIGQTLGWHAIFWLLTTIAFVVGIWISLRLAETLPNEERQTISPSAMYRSLVEIVTSRMAVGYTVAATLSFGGLLSFIVSSQQIFGGLYGLGDYFSLAFAAFAIISAIVSLSATRLIRLFGARFVVHSALTASAISSFILLIVSLGGTPPFFLAFATLSVSLAAGGIMQGNANAIALRPLGHIAGMASAIIGTISMTLGVFLGGFVGQVYNGTVQPLALIICIGSISALAAIAWAEHGKLFPGKS